MLYYFVFICPQIYLIPTLKQDQLKHFHPKTEQSTEAGGTLVMCGSCDFTVGSVLSDDGHSLASVLQCCCRLFMCGHAQVDSIHLMHTHTNTQILTVNHNCSATAECINVSVCVCANFRKIKESLH